MPSQSKLETVTPVAVASSEPSLKKKAVEAKKTSVTTTPTKVTKPRAKKEATTVATEAVPVTKSKKTVSTESTTPTPAKKAKVVSAEKKVSKKTATVVAPTESTVDETIVADANAASLRLNYNVDNKGYAYRTFKLISVDSVPVTKEHSATQSSRKKIEEYENKDRIILCPRNAASKIFTSWSYSNNTVDVTTTSHVICIKETTRKSLHRDFYYRVIREAKLNEYCVTSPDGKKKNICSKFTNKLTALKKTDILALTSVAPVPETVAIA
jgi:dipeptidyl aminopeptidase/acylaminoacyl peptidase